MTRAGFRNAYRRVRLWIRQHGRWPAEREIKPRDRPALECLYERACAGERR